MAGSQISTKRGSIASQYLKRSTQIIGSATKSYFEETLPTITTSRSELNDSLRQFRGAITNNQIVPKIRQLSFQTSFRKLNQWFLGTEDELTGSVGDGSDLTYDTEVDDGATIAEVQLSAGDQQAAKVSRAVVESSHRLMEAQISATANLMTGIDQLGATVSSGFQKTNELLGKLLEITTANTAAMIEVTADMVASSQTNAIDTGGRFNAGSYKKLVGSRLDSEFGALKVFGSILSGGSLDSSAILGSLLKSALDKSTAKLKPGLKALDDTVNELIVSSLIRLGDRAKDGTGIGMLGKLFGIRANRQTGDNRKADLEIKSVAFNTLTQEAVVSAIPGYLQRILKQLGGGDVVYDYKSRQFRSKAEMRREYRDNLASSGNFARSGSEVKKVFGGNYNRPEIRDMFYDLMVEELGSLGSTGARERLTSTSGKKLVGSILSNLPNAKTLKRVNSVDLDSLAQDVDRLRSNAQGVAQLLTQVTTDTLGRNGRLAEAQLEATRYHRDGSLMRDSGRDRTAILARYGIETSDSTVNGTGNGLATGGVDYTNMALYEIHKVLSTGINVYQVGSERRKRQADRFSYPELSLPTSYMGSGSRPRPKLSSLMEEQQQVNRQPGEAPVDEDGAALSISKDGFGTWGKANGKELVQALFSGDVGKIRDVSTRMFGEATSFAGAKLKAFFGEKDKELNFSGWLKESIFGRQEYDDQGNKVKKSRGILGSLDEYIFGPGGAKNMASRVKEGTSKWFKSAMSYFGGDKEPEEGADVSNKRKRILGGSLGAMAGFGLLGGPFGLIAGSLVGNALSGTEGIGEKIKGALFGKDYTDKKGREKHKLGILERVVNNITDPLRYQLGKTATALGALAKKNILGPLANLGEAIKDRIANSAASKFGKVFGWLFDKGSKVVQSIAMAPWKLLGLGGSTVRGGATAATGAFGGVTNFLADRLAVSDEAKAKLRANKEKYRADYDETIQGSEFYGKGGQRAWIKKQNELRKSRGGMNGLMSEELNADIHTTANLTEELVRETKSANDKQAEHNAKQEEVNAKVSSLSEAGLREGSIFTHDVGIHDRIDRIIEMLGGHYHKEEENQLANAMASTGVTAAMAGNFSEDDAKDAASLTDLASKDGVSKSSLTAKVKSIYRRNIDEGKENGDDQEPKQESFLSKALGFLGGLGGILKNLLPIVGIGAALLLMLKNGGLGEALGRLGTAGGHLIDLITGNNKQDPTTTGINMVGALGDVQVKDKWDIANPLGRFYHNATDPAGNMIENTSANTIKDDIVQQNLRRDLLGGTWNNMRADSRLAAAESLYDTAASQRAQGGMFNRARATVNELRGDRALQQSMDAEQAAAAPKTSTISGIGRSFGRIGVITAAGGAAGGIAGGIATMAGADEETAATVSRVTTAGTAGALTVNAMRSAVTPGKKSLVDKILDGIIKMTKFIGEKLGADKALKKVGASKIVSSFTALGSKIVKAISDKFDDIVINKISKKLAAVGIKNAAAVATAGLAIAGGAIVGLASGLCGTEHLFGILPGQADALMRTISGVFGAAFGALEMTPLGWIVVIFDVIDGIITAIPGFKCGIKQLMARKLYELMGGQENLAEKQEAFAAEKAYTEQKYGISYGNDATFNDEINGGGLLGRIWRGGTKLDEEGHVRRDAAGAVIHDGGIKGLFVGGEKKYATDANGEILRDEDGNPIQAIDRYGNALKEDGRWGDAVGHGLSAIGGFFGGRTIYKTDENGNVMYDENNKPIVEGEEKNIFGKAGDAFSAAKQAAGDLIKGAGEKVGGFLSDAKNAVGDFIFGKRDKAVDPEKAAELTDKSGKKVGGPIKGLLGQVNSVIGSKLSELSGQLKDVTDSKYELDENGQPLRDENGQPVVKGGLSDLLKRTIGGVGGAISKTVGGVLDTIKEKGLVGAASEGLKSLGDKVGGFIGGLLKTPESTVSAPKGRGITADTLDSETKFKSLVNGNTGLADRYIQKLSPTDTERLSYDRSGKAVKNLFYQGNYSKAYHMADAGCGPISAAFMTSLYGQTLTPISAAEIMNQAQWRDASGATSLEGIEAIGSKLGVELTSSKPKVQLLVNRLKKGEPIILLGKSSDPGSPYTAEGHYIVATGMDRNGFISVMDPLSDEGKRYKLADIMNGLESMTYTRREGLPKLIADVADDRLVGNVADGTRLLRTFAPVSTAANFIGRAINVGARAIKTVGSSIAHLFGKGEGAGYGPGENEHIDLMHNFPIYLQGGSSPWAKLPYTYPGGDQSMTMAKAACGPTSMAMVLAGATGQHFSPAVAAKYSMEHGYRVDGGTSHAYFKDIAGKYGLSTDKHSFNANELDRSLASGQPVIVSGRGSRPFTKSGHFVTVVGKENGKYLVNDPANHSGEYQTLSGASNMWPFSTQDGSPILGRSSYDTISSGVSSTDDATAGESTGILGSIFSAAKSIIAKFKSVFGLDVISDGLAENDRDPESNEPATGNNSVVKLDGPVEYLSTKQVAAIQTKREAKEIIDLTTMKVIKFSWAASPSYHSDCTPMTPQDVQTIKDILHPGGGVDWNDVNSWSWDGRPGVLKLNGRLIACGFHLRPHAAMMGGNPGAPFTNRSNTPFYYNQTQKWPLGGHICCYYGDSPGGTQSCNAAAKKAYELGNQIFKQQGATLGNKGARKLANKSGSMIGKRNPIGFKTDATGADEGIGGFGDVSPLNKTFKVTSPFGPRKGGMHNGIDLVPDDSSRQATVHSATPGTVASRGFNSSAGNYVTVTGDDGRLYQYYHLAQGSALQKGQEIKAGTVIGEMGTTGRSTGPHLHFGIKENGEFVDPSTFLRGASPATGSSVTGTTSSTYTPTEFTPDSEKSVIGQGLALVAQTAKNIAGNLMSTLGLSSGNVQADSSLSSSGNGGTDQHLKDFQSVAGDMAATIYNFLVAQGCSTAAACGVLGNAQQESGLRPDIKQYGGGPGRGLFQWEVGSGRFAELEKIARRNGKDWTDVNSQLTLLWQELTSSDINNRFKGQYASVSEEYRQIFERTLAKASGRGLPGGFDEWKRLTDVKLATSNFEGAYERAGKPVMENRWRAAKEFYDRFSKEAKMSPVSQRAREIEELTETGDNSYGGVGGANDVPGVDTSTGATMPKRKGFVTGQRASVISARYGDRRTDSIGHVTSAMMGKVASRLKHVGESTSVSPSVTSSPAPGSDEWSIPSQRTPDLELLETTLTQVLAQLQAINANTFGANAYLDTISRKDSSDRQSVDRAEKQMSQALRRQQQLHPRGANPFPYNPSNVSSVMSIVRPG